MKALITQSNYIPWKGYFDNIQQADVFVVFDDMQYTRRDWRNRNSIKTAQGLKWLTIPVEVKGKYFQKINETKISETNWQQSHLSLIKQNYSKSPFFNELYPWIESLYRNAEFEYITEVNVFFLKEVCSFLGINTLFLDSREFELQDGKTERLIAVCKKINATEYLTGPSAKSYIQEELFEAEKIKISYFDYEGYPEYKQFYPPFNHHVCIWDLILNTGSESQKYISKK